ncbi:hypothetical protein ACOKM5_06995 [Streptomyces sp. BH097]|uniref:hypothetical protein n=1 Tax=unclassified Streptomyces TaxID=2593676 RepID=UPI003BB5F968
MPLPGCGTLTAGSGVGARVPSTIRTASALPNQDRLTPFLLRAWLRDEPEVASWGGQWTGQAAGSAAAISLAGAVMTWPQTHGAVSLEVTGQFSGMGHDPATLLTVQTALLADTFQLP